MQSHTKRSTRIIIWVIAIVMALGFVGSYFLVMLENNNQNQNSQSQNQTNQKQPEQKVDETAYKVTGKVSELQKTDLKEGSGEGVKLGDVIRVHYKGTIAQSGLKFDSSYDGGEPVTFKLEQGGLIQGWVDGIPGMKVGGKRRLVIPANLAYGEQGTQGIAPNSDLVFEVELLAINPPSQTTAQPGQ